jgi:PBP1b-binding outer membrane lipoprotein LpoB
MAGRSRSSFNKRQKERSRQDKQREKLEKRQQRKLEKQSGVPGENDDFGQNDFSLAGDYEDPAEEVTASNSNVED